MNYLIFAGALLFFCGGIDAHNCVVSALYDREFTFRSVRLRENEVLSNISPNPRIRLVKFIYSQLHSVPAEIFDLFRYLNQLQLSEAEIQTIKENTFKNAKSLQDLNLWANKIDVLKTNTFLGCSSLEELGVHYNGLEIIQKGAFNGLPKLSFLDLGYNHIVEINENIFDPLVNLKKILLHHNKIKSINENTFKFNLKLEIITLYDNQLNSLSCQTFSELKNLNRLDLRRNKCVDKTWNSMTFRAIAVIEERLKDCDSNFVLDAIRSYLTWFKSFVNLNSEINC